MEDKYQGLLSLHDHEQIKVRVQDEAHTFGFRAGLSKLAVWENPSWQLFPSPFLPLLPFPAPPCLSSPSPSRGSGVLPGKQ